MEKHKHIRKQFIDVLTIDLVHERIEDCNDQPCRIAIETGAKNVLVRAFPDNLLEKLLNVTPQRFTALLALGKTGIYKPPVTSQHAPKNAVLL